MTGSKSNRSISAWSEFMRDGNWVTFILFFAPMLRDLLAIDGYRETGESKGDSYTR